MNEEDIKKIKEYKRRIKVLDVKKGVNITLNTLMYLSYFIPFPLIGSTVDNLTINEYGHLINEYNSLEFNSFNVNLVNSTNYKEKIDAQTVANQAILYGKWVKEDNKYTRTVDKLILNIEDEIIIEEALRNNDINTILLFSQKNMVSYIEEETDLTNEQINQDTYFEYYRYVYDSNLNEMAKLPETEEGVIKVILYAIYGVLGLWGPVIYMKYFQSEFNEARINIDDEQTELSDNISKIRERNIKWMNIKK